MGKQYESISEHHQQFIRNQKMFFVGTAADEGRVNVSPKGMDSLRIIDDKKIVWLNMTGSGNETAAHLLKNPRITIMFCAFEGKPLILRLYGEATIYHKQETGFNKYADLFPTYTGARQIVEIDVELVQSSCGFGVPLMDYKEERTTLNEWSDKKGAHGIKEYWRNRNQESIDGFDTGITDYL